MSGHVVFILAAVRASLWLTCVNMYVAALVTSRG